MKVTEADVLELAVDLLKGTAKDWRNEHSEADVNR